jgi:hypothetical protein
MYIVKVTSLYVNADLKRNLHTALVNKIAKMPVRTDFIIIFKGMAASLIITFIKMKLLLIRPL